jgi:hypothetical protein
LFDISKSLESIVLELTELGGIRNTSSPCASIGKLGNLNVGPWPLALAFPFACLALAVDPVGSLYIVSRAIRDFKSMGLSPLPRFACGSSLTPSSRSTRRRLLVFFLENSSTGGRRGLGSSGRGFLVTGAGGRGGVMRATVILRVDCDGSKDPNTNRSDSSGPSN